MKNTKAKRVTLYINQDELEHIERLHTAFKEETDFYPEMSTNKWLCLLLRSGQEAVAKRIESIREV